MKKYRSYFFLIFLVIGFLALGYYFLGLKSKAVEIIEINFISDHAIAKSGDDPIPSEIIAFSSSYTKNDTVDYLSRISFKRTDIGDYTADSLNNFRTRIDKSLKIRDAEEMFGEENNSKKATGRMYLNSDGSSISMEPDTSNIRYFFLVPMNDARAQGSAIYFDQAQKLKDFINEGLRQGNLFNDKKSNTITIILDDNKVEPLLTDNVSEKETSKNSQSNNSSTNSIPVSTREEQIVLPPPPKNIAIKASLKKVAQNQVQWSDDLKNYAESITIVFDNGFKKFTEDVTNKNNYLFESGDKDFDGVQCTVTLVVVLKSHVKLTDKPSLKLMTHC